MTTASKLAQKLQAATKLNNDLAAQIGDGNGATGLTATFFMNANKSLVKAQKEVRNAVNNGLISIEEYQSIIR
jgi:hypothetical protein